jgi:hypothetical protein
MYADILYREEGSKSPEEIAILVEMLEQFRFMRHWNSRFSDQEKGEIASCLKIKMVKAGERLFSDDEEKINQFFLVLAGKTGIFYSDWSSIQRLKRDELFDVQTKVMTPREIEALKYASSLFMTDIFITKGIVKHKTTKINTTGEGS